MKITAVESSTLATVAYDRDRELLRLEFSSGTCYQYRGVPVVVHEAVLRASSTGSYFNYAIRGRFPYHRVLNGPQQLDIAAGHGR